MEKFAPPELVAELIIRLAFRASELDIANEVLIIDGATPAFCRNLRVRFTERCKQEKRIRPYKNIIGANSRNEDGRYDGRCNTPPCHEYLQRAFLLHFIANC